MIDVVGGAKEDVSHSITVFIGFLFADEKEHGFSSVFE